MNARSEKSHPARGARGGLLFEAALLIFVVAAPAFAETPSPFDVRLAPAARQDHAFWPFRTAEITVRNPTSAPLQGLAVRWTSGGPMRLVPLVVPPGSEARATLPLPALMPQQDYEISSPPPSPTASATLHQQATLVWPVELVNANDFLAPQEYRRLENNLPHWPTELKKRFWLVCALLTVLATAAAVFLRRPAAQGAVLLLLAAGTCLAVVGLQHSTPLVIQKHVGGEGPHGNELLMLASRRTAQATVESTWSPLYFNLQHLADDQSVLLENGDMALKLQPQSPRLFRKK